MDCENGSYHLAHDEYIEGKHFLFVFQVYFYAFSSFSLLSFLLRFYASAILKIKCEDVSTKRNTVVVEIPDD